MNEFPYGFMARSIIKSSPDGEKVFSKIVNYLSCWAGKDSSGNTCENTSDSQNFIYIRERSEEYFDLNGKVMTPSRCTSMKYDKFGNLIKSKPIATDANGIHLTTSDNIYDNDVINWFIGRLRSSTVTNEIP